MANPQKFKPKGVYSNAEVQAGKAQQQVSFSPGAVVPGTSRPSNPPNSQQPDYQQQVTAAQTAALSHDPANIALQNQANQTAAQNVLSQQDALAQQQRLAANPQLSQAINTLQTQTDNQPLPQATTGGKLPGADLIGTTLAGAAAAGGAVGEGLPVIGGALAAAGAPVALTAGAAAAVALGGYFIFKEREKVSAYNKITSNVPKDFNAIMWRANHYQELGLDPNQIVADFNELEQRSYLNEANLKAESDNSLTEFLGAPGTELTAVGLLNDRQFRSGNYRNQLMLSLASPDKNYQATQDVLDVPQTP